MAEVPSRKIKLRNYIAYGAGDLYGGGAFFIVTTFSMFYLVNVVGMNPILAGLIPALGKIWDAVSDPMMGYIADNTRENRFGKRRVWFLVSILPIALSFTLIWFPAGFSSQVGKFIFYLFAYIFFFTVATVSYVPYAALSAEMTYDRKERNTLNGVRILFSFIATLIAGVAVKPIIDGFGGTATGYLVMGIVFGLVFALPWITLYFGTWELPQQTREQEKVHFFKNFLSMFESRSCRIHIAMYVCSYGTMDVFMAWIMFYFTDYLKMSPFFVVAQGSLLVTMMIVLPFYVKVANTKGHGTSYIIGLSIFLAGMVGLGLMPASPLNWLLVLNVVILGLGLAAGSLIPHQLLPFVVDVDRLMSGRERAGTYSAVMTLTRKLFLGLVILQGLGFLLSGIGYKSPVPTVLTADQYSAAFELVDEKQEKKGYDSIAYSSILTEAYVMESDGNFHLNYSGGAALRDREISDEEAYDLRLVLDDIGYLYTGIGDQQTLVQKSETVKSLHFYFIIFPIILCAAGIFFASRFKLTPENHDIVIKEIERLEAGGLKKDADDETKRISELLTGKPYDSLFGGRN